MQRIVLATTNPDKVKEIQGFLQALPFQFVSLQDVLDERQQTIKPIAETGDSFVENAIIKANAIYKVIQNPVLAEDSGLCIDALNGQPGIHSARFAASFNSQLDYSAVNQFILSQMLLYKFMEQRRAYYECSLVWMPNPFEKWIFSSRFMGQIAFEISGCEGFGYDPIFYLPDKKKTVAQISLEEKNQISHRGRALHSFYMTMLRFQNLVVNGKRRD